MSTSTALKQFSRISMASATNLAKAVQVEWADGARAEFPYCWLRDISKTARPSLVHLDVNTRPKAIECSSNALRVMWPPFLTYNFSSEFLREHAINHPTTTADSEPTTALAAEQTSNMNFTKSDVHLKEQLWTVTSTKTKIDERLIMGSFEWRDTAQEPGTIWAHLDVVPSLCIVDTLNGPANLTLVDSFRALTLLQQICPKEFKMLEFLSLEYAEGLFRARHSICTTKAAENGKVIDSAVFNNMNRSSVITVDALNKLESLHKFGRICAELSQSVTLNPGERLIINNKRIFLGKSAQKKSHVILSLVS